MTTAEDLPTVVDAAQRASAAPCEQCAARTARMEHVERATEDLHAIRASLIESHRIDTRIKTGLQVNGLMLAGLGLGAALTGLHGPAWGVAWGYLGAHLVNKLPGPRGIRLAWWAIVFVVVLWLI